jgi:hypothetical protein
MNASQMLHQMCHQVLSDTDVKAICKSRGFSAQEAASRALFENFFLSDIGLEAAIGSLTREEVTLLHLLKFVGGTVDIAFFERIYGGGPSRSRGYYGTFTQRYKDVFKSAQLSLVRKGVLLMAEADDVWDAKTKMERWRFRFPQEFERFLPPLIQSTRTFEGGGDFRSDVPRRKLREIVGGKQPSPVSADKQYDLRLVGGELRLGDRAFRAGHLLEWQRACWGASVPSPKKEARAGQRGKTVSPIEAATYAFSRLGEKEWVPPGQLSLPLGIFCDALLSGEQICAAGWQWGCLAKQEADGNTYYRLPEQEAEADVDPQYYLYAAADRPLVVNLETIPYSSLEHLAQISNLQAADSGPALAEGPAHLVASPNLIKMGHAPETLGDQPLTQWLRENAPPFRQALETVEQRWGKQIVHQELMMARVSDLGLKVQLERAFPDPKDVVFLPNDYIAFPRHLWAAVEKVVIKSGHVIRTVQP